MIHNSYLTFCKELSQKQLILGLTKQYQKEWDNLKKGKEFKAETFDEYIKTLQYNLSYKSLPEITINQIISKIKA